MQLNSWALRLRSLCTASDLGRPAKRSSSRPRGRLQSDRWVSQAAVKAVGPPSGPGSTPRLGGTRGQRRAKRTRCSLLRPPTASPSTSRIWSPGRSPPACALLPSATSITKQGPEPPSWKPKSSGQPWLVAGITAGAVLLESKERERSPYGSVKACLGLSPSTGLLDTDRCHILSYPTETSEGLETHMWLLGSGRRTTGELLSPPRLSGEGSLKTSPVCITLSSGV